MQNGRRINFACACVCESVFVPVCVNVCVCVCRLSLHVRCAFLTMRFLGQKRNHVCFVAAAAAEATHTHAHTYTHTYTYTRTGRLINEFSFSLGLAAGSRQHLQHASHNNLRRAAVKNFVKAFGGNNNNNNNSHI